MNETRREPTTGRQSPSLFDKWHGISYNYAQSHRHGWTYHKAFDNPVTEHWGTPKCSVRLGLEPTTYRVSESNALPTELARNLPYKYFIVISRIQKVLWYVQSESILVQGFIFFLTDATKRCTWIAVRHL